MTFERRHLAGRAYALVSTTMERMGVLAAFSERPGGASEGPFVGLNVSYTVGDDPGAVAKNRDRLTEGLGVPPFAVAGLAHGRTVTRVGTKRAGAGFHRPTEAISRVDGLFTATSGVSLAVTMADCVPVVMASEEESRVAVVHAGWRGIVAGVVASAVDVFSEPRSVRVVIGPAIGPCHYEVGEDVALAVAAASGAGATTELRNGHRYLDLVATVRGLLRHVGVRRVEHTGLCTACERSRFFSYRRDGGVTGRQAAVVMRLP